MKVLGIDQSYTKCAVVVLDDDEIERVEIFKARKGEDRYFQAWQLAGEIETVCEENKPDLIGIEGLAFGARGSATRDLAGLLFTIVCSLRFGEHRQDVQVYDPRTIKKYATGSGAAKKDEMYNALPNSTKNFFDELGLKKTTGREDATDAYWIARYRTEKG